MHVQFTNLASLFIAGTALAHERFPDNEEAAVNAAREAFDGEETVTYVAEQDAPEEEDVVLEAVRGATRF
jgi:hypothetical protein